MFKIKFNAFIFSLLFLCISYTSYSEEIDSLSIPLADEEETFSYTVVLKDSENKSTSALITITDTQSHEDRNYVITSEQKFQLPRGKYSARIYGGPRRIPVKFDFTLPAKNNSKTVTIRSFANLEPTGWIMLDTFYNPATAISKSSLQSLAQALQLHSIFTPLNNILRNSSDYSRLQKKDIPLLAPVTTYQHLQFGTIVAFNSQKPQAAAYNPIILSKPLYPLLAQLKDANNLTAISPIIINNKEKNNAHSFAEEFLFDTLTGPLYDFFILDNLNSLKIWHTLLNQGYRIPAVYIGNDSIYSSNRNPEIKSYIKIPRQEYSQKFLHETLKAGCFVISNGPFIRFFTESIGSKDENRKTGEDNTNWINGDSLKIGDVGFTSANLRNVYAEAFSASDPEDKVKALELIYNGKIIEKKAAADNQKNLSIMWKVVLDKPGWIQLRYLSTTGKFLAVTNPTYLVDYNTSEPAPIMARTEIKVTAAASDKPLKARAIVENFGIVINNIEISGHPVIIQAPATASITVEAAGYRSQTQSIYLQGGAAGYIRSLNKRNLLAKALINPISYQYLQKALNNSKLHFKLNKK